MLARLASDAEEVAGAGAQHTRTLPSFWAAKAALERQRQRAQRRHAASGGDSEEAGGEEGEGGEVRRPRKRARSAHSGEGSLANGMEVDGSEGEESLSSFRWAPNTGRAYCRQLFGCPLAMHWSPLASAAFSCAAHSIASDLLHSLLPCSPASLPHPSLGPLSLPPCSDLDRTATTLAQLADDSGAQLTPRSRAAYARIEREFDRLIAQVCVGCLGGRVCTASQ